MRAKFDFGWGGASCIAASLNGLSKSKGLDREALAGASGGVPRKEGEGQGQATVSLRSQIVPSLKPYPTF